MGNADHSPGNLPDLYAIPHMGDIFRGIAFLYPGRDNSTNSWEPFVTLCLQKPLSGTRASRPCLRPIPPHKAAFSPRRRLRSGCCSASMRLTCSIEHTNYIKANIVPRSFWMNPPWCAELPAFTGPTRCLWRREKVPMSSSHDPEQYHLGSTVQAEL